MNKFQEIELENKALLPDSLSHPLITKFKPRFLATGGENIVFITEQYPNLVIKISRSTLKFVIEYNILNGKSPGEKYHDLRSLVRREKLRVKQLGSFFNPEFLVPQNKMALKVPVTREGVRLMLGDKAAEFITGEVFEAWTIATIQQRVKELSGEHYSLVTSMAERKRIPDPAIYAEVTSAAVFDAAQPRVQISNLCLAQNLSVFRESLSVMLASESARNVLRCFIRQSIDYSLATGEIVDIIGNQNIIMRKEGDLWRLHVIDPLAPMHDILKKARTALEALKDGSRVLYKKERRAITMMLNYVRTLNVLAAELSIEKRIDNFFDVDWIGACGILSKLRAPKAKRPKTLLD